MPTPPEAGGVKAAGAKGRKPQRALPHRLHRCSFVVLHHGPEKLWMSWHSKCSNGHLEQAPLLHPFFKRVVLHKGPKMLLFYLNSGCTALEKPAQACSFPTPFSPDLLKPIFSHCLWFNHLHPVISSFV